MKTFFAKKVILAGFVAVLVLSGCEALLNNEFLPITASVEEAKDLKNGTYVKITGTIDFHLFGDWYIFSDSSGSMTVEIDGEVWAKAGIDPPVIWILPDSFEIIGIVDKVRSENTIIDVRRLNKI